MKWVAGLLLLAGLLGGCEVPWNAAEVVNATDQRLEIFRRNPRTGDIGASLTVISPGGDAALRGDCEESLEARWEDDGTVVAVREEPLCRGDTWVVAQP
jgi:hypothetical protein